MRGSSLNKILGVLSKKESAQLINFALNPLHNTRQDVVTCFKVLLDYHLEILNEEISEEKVFELMFPKAKKFNENTLRDTLFYTQRVFENYIAFEELQKNEEYKLELYNNFLFERGMFEESLEETKKLEKKILQSKKLERKHELDLYQSKIRQYLLEDLRFLKSDTKNIEQALTHLDNFYFNEKLKWSHELLAIDNFSSKEVKIPLLSAVMGEITKEPYNNNPFSESYYLITLFYKNNYSLEKFERLKAAVLKIIEFVNLQEKRSLITDLLNYNIKLYTEQGSHSLLVELHQIHLLGISNNAFVKKNKFKAHSAMNIVNVALRLNNLSWTESFIKEISQNIDNENALLIMQAMLAFHQNNFELVKDLLRDVEFVDLFYSMNAKSFLAKTYFMTQEYELLNYQLDAMDLFYRRHTTLSQALKESNLNFILTLKKIAKHVSTPSKLNDLAQKIESVHNMAYKAWVQNILKKLLG
jgi:hypothetical protein